MEGQYLRGGVSELRGSMGGVGEAVLGGCVVEGRYWGEGVTKLRGGIGGGSGWAVLGGGGVNGGAVLEGGGNGGQRGRGG